MSNVFVPQLVVQRWVSIVLKADATVVSEVGGVGNIHPNIDPTANRARHLTHVFGGPEGGIRAEPIGRPLSLITLYWDITAWEPSFSQQSVEALLIAAKTVLIGADARGKQHIYTDATGSYRLGVAESGPVLVPLELTSGGQWAPVSERYQIALRKAA